MTTAATSSLVDVLVAGGFLQAKALRAAFEAVDRSIFVADGYIPISGAGTTGLSWRRVAEEGQECIQSVAASDRAVATRINASGVPVSSASQPSLVARMLQSLDVRRAQQVLEIGTGTGYNAAILSNLVAGEGMVVSYDNVSELIPQVERRLRDSTCNNTRIVAGDGWTIRHELEHQFDRVIVTAAAPGVSPRWLRCAKPGALLLVPIQHAGLAPLLRLGIPEDSSRRPVGQYVGWADFMPMEVDDCPTPWVPSVWRRFEPTSMPHFASLRPSDLSTVRGWQSNSPWKDFFFFMSLNDRRTTITARGIGLADPRTGDLAEITVGGVEVAGSLELGTRLDLLYKEWEQLGSPKLTDWYSWFEDNSRSLPHPGQDGSVRGWSTGVARSTIWHIHRTTDTRQLFALDPALAA